MKKLIRLTESDLHRIVKESVKRILGEMDEGKFVNNKSFFNNFDNSGKAGKGEVTWKFTNRDKDPKALEKHNRRAKEHNSNLDKLASREAQLKDSKKTGTPPIAYDDTIEGKWRDMDYMKGIRDDMSIYGY